MPISKEELIDIICNSCHIDSFCTANCPAKASAFQYAKEHGLLIEPEMAWYQRSEEEIQASLDRLGYIQNDEGNWEHHVFPIFFSDMWGNCGKRIIGLTEMIPEWVELKEVQE